MNGKNLLLGGLALAAWAWGLAGCGSGPKSVQGEYIVTGGAGAASASVSYSANGTNSLSQAVSVSLPWSYGFTGYETEGNDQGTYVYLSAVNDSASGTVTVTIQEDGSVFRRGAATGAGAAVTASGNF